MTFPKWNNLNTLWNDLTLNYSNVLKYSIANKKLPINLKKTNYMLITSPRKNLLRFFLGDVISI